MLRYSSKVRILSDSFTGRALCEKFTDTGHQWTSGTEQSITLRQEQASWGDMNFSWETCPIQRKLSILMWKQVPGLCATSTAASGASEERQRGITRWVQEGAVVGSKEKRNFLQRNKNLRKSLKRFRKKWTVLRGGHLLHCMTHYPTTTSRTRMVQMFALIFTPGWGKIPAESKTAVIRWERLFGMQLGSRRLEIKAACVTRMKDLQKKNNMYSLHFYKF